MIPEHHIYLMKNSFSDFVSIRTNLSNKNLLFLVDTEATVSLLKFNSLSRDFNYNKNEIIKLTGITSNPLFSLGSINLGINEQNFKCEHKCHLVSDNFPIPSNGILGKDFLKRFKCLIDYREMTVSIRKSEFESIKIPIKSELLHGLSAIPPRSETFKILHIKSEKFPCIVEAQEIEDGILVSTSIVHEPDSWIRVLNTHDSIKMINTEQIKTSQISDFHVLQIKQKKVAKFTKYFEEKSTGVYAKPTHRFMHRLF